MGTKELLLEQSKSAYKWTDDLVKEIDFDLWHNCPEGIDSTLCWQIGHLTTRLYYHTVMCLVGHNPEVLKTVPLKEYSELFSFSKAKDSINKVSSEEVLQNFRFVQKISLSTIADLKETSLQEELYPTDFPNPVAKTKLEAIDWNSKHTMWHCGQIAMIRRAINSPVKFG